ncbi:hypothetical protein HAX54_030103 [Datura stramonium]|uniref:Uncharacterized protein n=1 Tax=Datura stramonium TaxID=4076 RepID=A0ABS8VAI1_DATST|nr:hypothetical protein [Datura stramonium]
MFHFGPKTLMTASPHLQMEDQSLKALKQLGFFFSTLLGLKSKKESIKAQVWIHLPVMVISWARIMLAWSDQSQPYVRFAPALVQRSLSFGKCLPEEPTEEQMATIIAMKMGIS